MQNLFISGTAEYLDLDINLAQMMIQKNEFQKKKVSISYIWNTAFHYQTEQTPYIYVSWRMGILSRWFFVFASNPVRPQEEHIYPIYS